ncbi:MAG: winged helix-turn-helix transcriptional regulator [Candidatus Thorarchaeota archaeon]|jgi:DNA-binding Lrp family transcriptional regulator
MMDSIDKSIFIELCGNCRVSYESLARKTGLSPTAVKNRVNNLIESGFVSQFKVILNHKFMDAEDFQAIVITDGTERIEELVNTIGTNPMVGHISTMASVNGGAYLVWGQYEGSEMLYELGSFLRGSPEVHTVEFHPLRKLTSKDAILEVEFSKLQRRVLSALLKDPRMLMSDIAQKTELSPKSVRRALREIMDDEFVHFRARPDLAAGGLVNLNLKIEWDEKKKTIEDLDKWLRKEYPLEFWDPFVSALEPIVFAEFMVDDLHEAESISRRIRELPYVNSTTTLVSYSSAKFPYIAEIKLREMVKAKT